ncbi:alpha/beta hydrolase [Crocosphaera sp. XPORK-15E]|uniref:alpha/beta hydrolase n=1 Tax=Crocosphaera sp. XPORK-15E TaxID=3110247 RepID=UPI002B20BC87|nr:alpha/beta hydrolase [Crocosphaera sp. XPORK-15E]MEA5533293.1 alpha/beta hydrolase [Crocosphaera sp. XPORK-15E]
MLKSKLSLFFLGLCLTCLTSIPVKAAEKLLVSYGSLLFSLRIDSLETFAKTGTINEDLGLYLNLVTPEQQAEFRTALTKKANVEPLLVSRFFNTKMGQAILTRTGKGVTIQGGGNGGYALRGAIVSAAFDPEGLTLLNVLKKYPTNIQLQGELIQGFTGELEQLVAATETLVTRMEEWTAEEAKNNPPVNYATLTDLRKPGKYEVKKEVWQLTDKSRNRSFYVDVYIPQNVGEEKTNVLVFSHGLASRPEDYNVGLQHLASYGYLVAAPQHPGSDTIYLQEMFEGYHRDIFDLNDFINRPKDISFVIDELQRRNNSQFQGKLELENVGMAGHSFGGYTTLAIAGATIDFEHLEKSCNRLYNGINISNLLECRALELPRQDYNFRDNRVKAVLAGNPVNRNIFGQKGLSKITIPTLLLSGSDDPATPPALNQASSFTFLTTPNKYWGLIEGQAHVNFTKLDGQITDTIDSVSQITFPSQNLIGSYVNGISTAFFQVYIGNNESYRPYLQSSFAQYLSQNETFKFSFITRNSTDKLEAEIEQFKIEQFQFEN